MDYGSSGKLKKLLDRLTVARGDNLDNINATITSRAPASTAVSNAILTAVRAANLDNLDASISGIETSKHHIQVLSGAGTWVRPAGVALVHLTAIAAGGSGAGGIYHSSNWSYWAAAQGGGSGEGFSGFWPVTGDVDYVVGAGGSGQPKLNATTGNAGEDGGNTEFGGLILRGGFGGPAPTATVSAPTVVGSGYAGQISLSGGPRYHGNATEALATGSSRANGGDGADSEYAQGGPGGILGDVDGKAADGAGAGSGGGHSNESNSAATAGDSLGAGDGMIILQWWE